MKNANPKQTRSRSQKRDDNAKFETEKRPLSLDPDRATFEDNERRIMALGQIGATANEVAAALGIAREVLEAFFSKYPEIRERFEQAAQTGNVVIRRAQFKHVETSPAMAIHLGINTLGQTRVHREENPLPPGNGSFEIDLQKLTVPQLTLLLKRVKFIKDHPSPIKLIP